MHKDKINKTKSTKKIYRYTSEEVANMANCSVSYVKKLRAGIAEQNTDKARMVIAIDDLLMDGSNKLLEEVERILK